MRFYNRTSELSHFGEVYERSGFHRQLLYVSGRRRVGKTTLMNEFARDHKGFYLFVGRYTVQGFLEQFATALSQELGLPPFLQFKTLDEAFGYFFNDVLPKVGIAILDEFQNGAAVSPAFFSIFQKHWDAHKDKGGGMVVCCGSMQSMMHTIFEGSREPLYKRATARMHVDEFSPSALNEMLSDIRPRKQKTDFIDLYAVFGGIPFYYYLIEANGLMKRSFWEIVQRIVLEKTSMLYDEGRELTVEAFGQRHSVYYAILAAVACGHTKTSEIANRVGQSSSALEPYLRQLVSSYRFIHRIEPITSKKPFGKTTRYAIADNFMNFWFRYVFANRNLLESQRTEAVLQIVQEDFPRYRGFMFERCIRSLLAEGRGTLAGFSYNTCGRYFDQKGTVEIDVLMLNESDKTMSLGECKYNLNSSNVPSLIENVRAKAESVSGYALARIFLFSALPLNTRTRNLVEKEPGVTACELGQLLEVVGR